jgi:activator of HSP90 ATPase
MIITTFKADLPIGLFRISKVKEFKGESSVSIRKGKKIVSYDYNVRVKWEMDILDGDKKPIAEMTGEIHFPEISNDIDNDGDDYEMNFTWSTGAEHRSRVEKCLRSQMYKEFRSAVQIFVTELKEK